MTPNLVFFDTFGANIDIRLSASKRCVYDKYLQRNNKKKYYLGNPF